MSESTRTNKPKAKFRDGQEVTDHGACHGDKPPRVRIDASSWCDRENVWKYRVAIERTGECWWAPEDRLMLANTKRKLTKDDPEGWYAVRFHAEGLCTIFRGALYWDGQKLRPEPGCWSSNDPDNYEILSGPLLSESDFMQREDVKRWKRIEEAAKEAVEEGRARGHYDSVQLFKDGIKGRAPKGAALIDLLFPPVPFTPPPKPELRLWRDNHGHVKWAASKPLDVNEDAYVEHWYEIDSTGQPIGEHA